MTAAQELSAAPVRLAADRCGWKIAGSSPVAAGSDDVERCPECLHAAFVRVRSRMRVVSIDVVAALALTASRRRLHRCGHGGQTTGVVRS